MLEVIWPLTMLIFLEFPWSVICRLGIAGGTGIDFGSPPSKLSDKVALSPTATVSRSRVAVKLAPDRGSGPNQGRIARRAGANRSREAPGRLVRAVPPPRLSRKRDPDHRPLVSVERSPFIISIQIRYGPITASLS